MMAGGLNGKDGDKEKSKPDLVSLYFDIANRFAVRAVVPSYLRDLASRLPAENNHDRVIRKFSVNSTSNGVWSPRR